jgi:L-threonylcarbamoyladenylate synthase
MDDIVRAAARIIRQGGVILYPTDTIWGIGCDATNFEGVQRIYHIKKRPDRKSMLVLMNEPSMLSDYLEYVPEQALELIRTAEKPTTIIYPGAKNVAQNLPAGDGSIGIRITGDPFCKKLIEETGLPLVSTSANISGDPSPLSFEEISTEIRNMVDHVVNWRRQEKTKAIPSTVIKIDTKGGMVILRS